MDETDPGFRRGLGTRKGGDLVAPGGPLNNEFPADLLFDRRGQLLVANLGAVFTEPVGNIKAFHATTGQFLGNFATGIFGASQLLLTPKP